MTSMAEMRACQQAYLAAQERLRQADGEMGRVEERYIAEKGIVNAGGTIPRRIMDIHDDDAFIEADAACSAIADSAGLLEGLRQAAAALDDAKNALVKATVELLPDSFRSAREALEKGAKLRAPIKEEIIRRGLGLDTGLEEEMEAAQEVANTIGLEL